MNTKINANFAKPMIKNVIITLVILILNYILSNIGNSISEQIGINYGPTTVQLLFIKSTFIFYIIYGILISQLDFTENFINIIFFVIYLLLYFIMFRLSKDSIAPVLLISSGLFIANTIKNLRTINRKDY